MNKVILMGRLTKDPEVRFSQGANALAIGNFSIAVDRRFKREGEPDADFFNCTAFGKTGEFVEKYLKKGTKVVVVGHIQNNNYTNKQGEKVYSVQVMVDEVEFAESKNAAQTNVPGVPISQPAQPQAPQPSTQEGSGFMNIPEGVEDTLPFN